MSTVTPAGLGAVPPSEPLVLELRVDALSYRIVLPHADTDYIQKKLAAERVPYEYEMLEDMRARVAHGSLVLDIGANIGNHALFLSAVAGLRVEAFEPNPDLCEGLRRSIVLNGLADRLHLHQMGLGRGERRARFAECKPENLGSQSLVLGDGELRVRALDGFAFGQQVAAIKLDVEGMEIDVLEGAVALLARDRPMIYVECTTEKHFRLVSRWMTARDYAYVDTFNATPTHLFIPAERFTMGERLMVLQSKAAQSDYKSAQLLREIRLRLAQAQSEAQARERAAIDRLADEQRVVALTRELSATQQEAQQLRERAAIDRLADEQRVVALTRELSATQQAAQQQRELDALAIRRLERIVEVREARLAATERRAAALTEKLQRLRETRSFRVGLALIDARRSLSSAVRLPLTLLGIYRNALAQHGCTPLLGGGDGRAVEESSRAPKPAIAAPKPAHQRLPATLTALSGRSLSSLRVAAVMDEFTEHSFAPECDLLPLRAPEWLEQVERFRPDLVFIESAWRGAEGLWTQKISNPSNEIMGLIAWAHERRVPTVFWCKEDPVHFGSFLHLAKAVDHVFTTDIDCIARYKREVGHDRVYLLPFAAQPATHNPVETFPRENGYCFAGSYYLKYPERQRDFGTLLEVIREVGRVDIFDRNFDKPHPHYEFPPEYHPFIVGNLPFDKIDRAYKGYRYGINMNTIKQSQTMFARRVFELLASNTVVVSNFSRGVRLMFGDLVVCSDAADELRRRLDDFGDDLTFRKFRLAGLRKVMSEHTYAHRLAYIVGKIGGGSAEPSGAGSVCAVAYPRDMSESEALLQGWQRQSLRGANLCLVGPGVQPSLAREGVTVLPDAAALATAPPYAAARWIAPLSAGDYHGPHYLADLLQATRFGQPTGVGKAAHYRCVPGVDAPELVDAAQAYRQVEKLSVRASLLDPAAFQALQLSDADALECATWSDVGLISIDEFNYLRDAGPSPSSAALATISDLENLRTGINVARDLIPRAERIAPAAHETERDGHDCAPGLSPQQMAELLPRSAGAKLVGGRLYLRGSGDLDKHRYFYLDRIFPRGDLNLETNSRYELIATRDESLDVRTVFEFLDEQKVKISHAMVKIGAAHSMAIPARCRFVRFGMRLQGSGQVRIDRLVLADLRERPSTLVPTGDCLLVAKQYPAYDDLYRYGFVHSRVRAYRAAGTKVDVLRLNMDEPCTFREFEGSDVTQGDRDLLDLALREGQYQHVLVHLLDAAMWETLERHLDRIRITVWVHGAEIQTWERRAFDLQGLDEVEIARRKALSVQRADFWRRILASPHPNLRLVFVSRYIADEAVRDLGVDLSRVEHHIIPNFIDGTLFPYRTKNTAMRGRILSVRPYASRAYGNDLMVEAIHQLACRPVFRELSFRIIGDGDLFESITGSLADYPNVTVERRFLPQAEIARLHADYGVFLCPSRMDTQGVSRDEAMASGLVPVTNRVAAVPEFTDDSCAVLAEPESAAQLATAIEALHADPQRFQALSAAAARRVRSDRSFEHTIARELALIKSV